MQNVISASGSAWMPKKIEKMTKGSVYMKTPLYTALVNHAEGHHYSFHVPGHHNGDVFFDEAKTFLKRFSKWI